MRCIGRLLALASLAPLGCLAATLTVKVVDQAGQPVEDAVVTLQGNAAPPASPVARTIDQRQLTFLPFVQVLQPGDSVVFRNSDRTRHHVYSFSAVRAFEFVLAPGEQSRALVLDRPGVAAVGCNIHDNMLSYLYVTPWPAARSDASGAATLRDVPAGRYSVHVWQPRLPPGTPEGVPLPSPLELGVTQARTLQVTLRLRPDPRRGPDHEHAHY